MSEPSETPATLPPPLPWITWFLITGFFVALIVGFWGGTALNFAKKNWSDYLVDQVKKSIETEDWQAAYNKIAQANRWQPDSPDVIRATLNLLQKTNGDPALVIQKLRRLDELQQSTAEDHILLGQVLISHGDAAGARAAFAKVPEQARHQLNAMELIANILREEGRIQEAEEILRQALVQKPNDPLSRLRLAVLDFQAAFPELRQKSRQTLWELARQSDAIALKAIAFLAEDRELTSAEAQTLLTLVEAHPTKVPATRYVVLSALLRLQPQNREDIVLQEIAASSKKGLDDLGELLTWLAKEKRPQQVLQLIPDAAARRSAEILDHKLRAMGELGYWEQVRDLLSKPAEVNLSKGQTSLWLATAYEHLEPDLDRTRQHLTRAFEASGHGREGVIALRAAEMAERLGQWDLAMSFYDALANTHPRMQMQMLEKIYTISLQARDTDNASGSAARLFKLWPNNLEYAERVLYLRLLTGDAIEVSVARTTPPSTVEQFFPRLGNRLPPALFQALAAFRIGDMQQTREWIVQVVKPERLDAGPRAVYAGLLSAVGQVGPAYRFAEQVPSSLLLAEEMRFLNRAL